MLLAACVKTPGGSRIADFGAGCGVAGMAVAARLTGVAIDLVERNTHALALVRRSLQLGENAALTARIHVIDADIATRGAERERAGLLGNAYDHIIANPPYNPPTYQASPDEARASAHVAPPSLEPWFETAAACLKANGQITFILRPEALPDILTAIRGRFATLRVRPVQPRADQPASRILVRATKGTKAPLAILPPLVLHEADGRWRDEIDAVLHGRAAIEL